MTTYFSSGGAVMPGSNFDINEGINTEEEWMFLVFQWIKYSLPHLRENSIFIEHNNLLYVNDNWKVSSVDEYYRGNNLFQESYKKLEHFFWSSVQAAQLQYHWLLLNSAAA
jgi:hypothetical protein